MPNCLSCDQAVAVPADSVQGEILGCAGCGSELELFEIEPVQLVLAPELDEDWGE